MCSCSIDGSLRVIPYYDTRPAKFRASTKAVANALVSTSDAFPRHRSLRKAGVVGEYPTKDIFNPPAPVTRPFRSPTFDCGMASRCTPPIDATQGLLSRRNICKSSVLMGATLCRTTAQKSCDRSSGQQPILTPIENNEDRLATYLCWIGDQLCCFQLCPTK
jgi:hypothetical protein